MVDGSMNSGARLIGDKQLVRMFDQLPRKPVEKVLRAAVRSGGLVLRKETAKNAPVGPTGNLKANIKVRTKKYQQTVLAVIGGSYPKGAHAHLVELGHGGPHPAPPHPFMRPAFDARKHDATTKTLKSINKGLEREARKLLGR